MQIKLKEAGEYHEGWCGWCSTGMLTWQTILEQQSLLSLTPFLEKKIRLWNLHCNTLTLCRSFKAEKLKKKAGSQRHLEKTHRQTKYQVWYSAFFFLFFLWKVIKWIGFKMCYLWLFLSLLTTLWTHSTSHKQHFYLRRVVRWLVTKKKNTTRWIH